MARVITFSRQFQTNHPKKGEPTYFVEKIWESIRNYKNVDSPQYHYMKFESEIMRWKVFEPKHHTIRQGYRWKVGDKFSPRAWSGKPYQSKQIIIAPEIEIKKIWNFSRDLISDKYYLNGHEIDADKLELIAKNDGLTVEDFKAWINKPFLGQVLCWNEHIEY